MRHIVKTEAPDYFTQETATFSTDTLWKELHCKPDLRAHLITEQGHLCTYCEGKFDEHNSHIEHLLPQTKHPQLRFAYRNLVVSCNGEQCCSDAEKDSLQKLDIHCCGHRKHDDCDEQRFLNPVEHADIQDYFAYNRANCELLSSGKDNHKADYMIRLLNLNSAYLTLSRHNARAAFVQVAQKYPHQIKALLNRASPPLLSASYKPASPPKTL